MVAVGIQASAFWQKEAVLSVNMSEVFILQYRYYVELFIVL
jgi:hypothetical protein